VSVKLAYEDPVVIIASLARDREQQAFEHSRLLLSSRPAPFDGASSPENT
jgi:hypothetical protein